MNVLLLSSLIFEPKLDENGNFFFDEDIEAEKRILIEKLILRKMKNEFMF